MGLAVPHLLSFYNPLERKSLRPKASKNATGLQLVDLTVENFPPDGEPWDEREFSVFLCKCGKGCRVNQFIGPQGDVVQQFLTDHRDCDCGEEFSPNDIRYIQAPLSAKRIPLSASNSIVSHSTKDSYSEAKSLDSGTYDLTKRKFVVGEASQGFTLKRYENKRPTIFFWSKSSGRPDTIRDVTFSVTRGRTKVSDSFVSNALVAVVGNSLYSDLTDWNILVTKYLSAYRKKITPVDMLYIVACPHILRFGTLTKHFQSRGNDEIDVYPYLLDRLAANSDVIKNPELLYKAVLPECLHSSIPMLNTISENSEYYLPSLALISKYFTDPEQFNQLCHNLTMMHSPFMRNLLVRGQNYSVEVVDEVIGYIAKKSGQGSLCDILSSCATTAGFNAFKTLCDTYRRARRTETEFEALESMEIKKMASIQKFSDAVSKHLASFVMGGRKYVQHT